MNTPSFASAELHPPGCFCWKHISNSPRKWTDLQHQLMCASMTIMTLQLVTAKRYYETVQIKCRFMRLDNCWGAKPNLCMMACQTFPITDDNSRSWAVDHFWHDFPRMEENKLWLVSQRNLKTTVTLMTLRILRICSRKVWRLGPRSVPVCFLRFWSPMPHIFSRVNILGSCRFRVWGPLLPKLNSGVCAGIWAEGSHDGVVATLQGNVGNSMDFVVSVSTIKNSKENKSINLNWAAGLCRWHLLMKQKRSALGIFAFLIHDKTTALIPGYVINTGLIQVWTGWWIQQTSS